MKNSSYFLIEYKNDAQFECQIDKIVTSVKVYLLYFILFKGRVQQYHLYTQIFNTFLDQFLLIFMRYEITIDTQLNFVLMPVKIYKFSKDSPPLGQCNEGSKMTIFQSSEFLHYIFASPDSASLQL